MVPNANRNPKKRRISLIPVPSVYPSVAAKNAAVGALEHVPFLRNRNMLSFLSFAHVLVGEPASTSPEHALGVRYFLFSAFFSDLFSGFLSDTSVHSYVISVFSPHFMASPTLTLASQAGPTFWVDFLQQVYFLPLMSRGPHSSAWANPAEARTNEHAINRFLNELIEPPWSRSLRRNQYAWAFRPRQPF